MAGAAAGAEIRIEKYVDETQLPLITALISDELSEPYTIFTYRYFINQWPQLCFLAMSAGSCIGVIVCKLDMHRESYRGYIAMLAVDKAYRKRGIGSLLVSKAIQQMEAEGANEVVLETEVQNAGALALYENLGFIREKRLHRYYLNGTHAYRLKLPLCNLHA
eukprot:tig00000194_g14754.t1